MFFHKTYRESRLRARVRGPGLLSQDLGVTSPGTVRARTRVMAREVRQVRHARASQPRRGESSHDSVQARALRARDIGC